MATRTSMDGWKLSLALLVGVFFTGMIITFFIAARGVSRVVDADYYSHGVHYGRTGSGSTNPGMAWNISASVAAGNLRVCVKDAAGSPVCGGTLRFKPEAEAAGKTALALAESAPGVFTATSLVTPQGDLRGTLLFTLGEAVATQKLVIFN